MQFLYIILQKFIKRDQKPYYFRTFLNNLPKKLSNNLILVPY